jgi:predicted RNase H-like HicB family nuclease
MARERVACTLPAIHLHFQLVRLTYATEQELDGRWIAEVVELPGVLAYGVTAAAAVQAVQALALRVVAEQVEHGERQAPLTSLEFIDAAA